MASALRAVLILDESGAKGYSERSEAFAGEVGLMAGHMIPTDALKAARQISENIFKRFRSNQKLHLTDLPADQQKEAREILYKIFLQNRACWFYEAISVQGFHESAHDENRGGSQEKELLHARLFRGIFQKSLSRLLVQKPTEISLTVITDRLDKSIIKKFHKEVEPLVQFIQGKPMTRNATVYNRENNVVEKYELRSSIDIPALVKSIQCEIICEDTAMTFMSDILANSALYYVQKNMRENPNIWPNSGAAIEGHPLASLLHGLYDSKDQPSLGLLSDTIHRRNKA